MERAGRLEGKVAVITGAANGIGRATAVLFAREGARMALADVNEEGLKETYDLVKKEKGEAFMKRVDVSIEQDVRELMERTLNTFGQIDILCNNAGIGGGIGTDEQVWKRVYDVNVLSAVYGIKYAGPHMQERKKGSIVNTASVAGIRAGAGGNAYSASKAALINYTKTAACDMGGFNVRVNAVCPGLIETGMTKRAFDHARDTGKIQKMGYRCELRRYGVPEEVAYAILFLASDESSYITGQSIPVDGGNTCSLNLPGMKY
ncbi:MAG: SDR family oxidoreductase [Deltaproteobacteria bacterium]|nr:SDR family oxidoreductase [Deltaproteobacteria bacterium]